MLQFKGKGRGVEALGVSLALRVCLCLCLCAYGCPLSARSSFLPFPIPPITFACNHWYAVDQVNKTEVAWGTFPYVEVCAASFVWGDGAVVT